MSGVRYTLTGPHRYAQEIRKSQFLAQAAPADSPQAAADFIARVADPAATHNCWAWRVGDRYRFHDDGEPAGTAGRPIFAAIDAQGLDRVAVVVTRRFGGIKLGAGGLARAYGGCAAECLRQAPKRACIECTRIEASLPAAALPLLRARLPRYAASVVAESFAASTATLTIELAAEHLDALRVLLTDLSRGRATIRRLP
jgi:uncharacterized YigZ family protein